jgi:protein-L-isoaspartate(D-aspartate) O-methyltransferase
MSMDFARARHLMVECQVRTNDVTDMDVLAAFRRIPREAYMPAALATLAYSDQELEVAPGRFLLRPRDIAKLLQALSPRAGMKALEIAGATGYGAALMATCGADVTVLEPDPGLLNQALSALKACELDSVRTASTALQSGWRDDAPYDVILVNGAVEHVPERWISQLAEGGRLAVIVRNGPVGSARLYTKAHGVASDRGLFDAAPPILPTMTVPKEFAF